MNMIEQLQPIDDRIARILGGATTVRRVHLLRLAIQEHRRRETEIYWGKGDGMDTNERIIAAKEHEDIATGMERALLTLTGLDLIDLETETAT